MRVLASPEAVDLIAERGGRLYVWLDRGHCCGGAVRLVSANEAPRTRAFEQVAGCELFDLYLPTNLGRHPEELHLEVRRFPRRLEAYWNGCAWVT